MKSIFSVLVFIVSISSSLAASTDKQSSAYLTFSREKNAVANAIYNYITSNCPVIRVKKLKNYDKSIVLKGYYIDPESMRPYFYILTPTVHYKHNNSNITYIMVHLRYKLPDVLKTAKAREKLLKLTSNYLFFSSYPQKIVIYKDYIYLGSTFQVTENNPIPTKMIINSIIGISINWPEYYKMLQKNFELPSKNNIPQARAKTSVAN